MQYKADSARPFQLGLKQLHAASRGEQLRRNESVSRSGFVKDMYTYNMKA